MEHLPMMRPLHNIDRFCELKRVARWSPEKMRTFYDATTTAELKTTWRHCHTHTTNPSFSEAPHSRNSILQMLSRHRKEMLECTDHSRSLMNLSFINVLKKSGEVHRKRGQHKVKNSKLQRRLETQLPLITPEVKASRSALISEQPEKILTSFSMAFQKLQQRSISRFFGLREGACMIHSDKQLVLYGGFAGQFDNCEPHVNVYDIGKKQWSKPEIAGEGPTLSYIGSTVEEWKGNLYFIGGMSRNLFGKKHQYPTEMTVLNLDKGEWSKGRAIDARRYHTSTRYQHNILIYGGINEKEQYVGSIMIVNLLFYSGQQIYQLAQDADGIAYHRIASTMELEAKKRMDLKKDGVYCFGGKNNNGQFIEGLKVLNLETNSNGQLVPKQWVRVKTDGPSPRPRINHSMSILPRLTSLCIIGGQNQNNEVLRDVHILNLLNLNWYQPQLLLEEGLSRGLSGHCAAVSGSKIYVFGGLRNDARYSTELLEVETDQTKVQCCLFKQRKPNSANLSQQDL